MFVVETQPQCLLWRHGHNVCCGDIATMFVVETQPQCLLWRHGHNVCCGDITTMFVVETQPQCLLWRHSHNVCCGDIATMFVVETQPQCLLQVQSILLFFSCIVITVHDGFSQQKRGTISSGAFAVSFLLKFTLSVFCSLFLFYLYVCNYVQFCCCILYSDHSFTLKLLIFFYKKKSIRERNFFLLIP